MERQDSKSTIYAGPSPPGYGCWCAEMHGDRLSPTKDVGVTELYALPPLQKLQSAADMLEEIDQWRSSRSWPVIPPVVQHRSESETYVNECVGSHDPCDTPAPVFVIKRSNGVRSLDSRDKSYSLSEVMDAVAELHPAIEFPDSRFEDFTIAGAPRLAASSTRCVRRAVTQNLWDARNYL